MRVNEQWTNEQGPRKNPIKCLIFSPNSKLLNALGIQLVLNNRTPNPVILPQLLIILMPIQIPDVLFLKVFL